MRSIRALCTAGLVACLLGLGGAPARGQGVELHGADSTFVAEGLALMWAVLRGQDEESTLVHLRIAKLSPAAEAYRFFSMISVDPFSGDSRVELRGAPLEEDNLVVMPRSTYQSFSSKRLLFHRDAGGPDGPEAALTIYYLGLPDTSPEFADLEALRAYFDDTLRRLAGSPAARSN